MRVAFVGKGGSGKTTLSALFIRHLTALGLPVLAIDADINQHLGQALGLPQEQVAAIPPLGAELLWIKEQLRGSNPRIGSAHDMIKTTPPGRGSRMLTLDRDDLLHRHFARPVLDADPPRAHLMLTGDFEPDDIGVSCYHSKTGAVELYLNHLVDGPGEYVVVDMTAGADAFASGLFTRFDLIILVCEPTRRGVGVYRQFRQHTNGHGVVLQVMGNKVAGEEDIAWLRDELGAPPLAAVGHSAWVRAAEQGHPPKFTALEPEMRQALDAVRTTLDGLERDWAAYHRNTVHFHLRNAAAWGNRSAGTDLAEQVDPGFVPGNAPTAVCP